MNSLSWLLYVIDVIGNLKTLTLLLMIGCLAGVALLALAVPVSDGDVLDWAGYKKWFARCVIIAPIAGLLFSVLPSQNTLYAIAASEVGERVVNSETVQGLTGDATKALHEWIRRQITPEPEPKRR